MEHIEIKNSLDSKLQIFYICSVRIPNILEVIEKNTKGVCRYRCVLLLFQGVLLDSKYYGQEIRSHLFQTETFFCSTENQQLDTIEK